MEKAGQRIQAFKGKTAADYDCHSGHSAYHRGCIV